MLKVRAEIVVRRPPRVVAAAAADPTTWSRWDPALAEVVQTAGEGPGLGARYRLGPAGGPGDGTGRDDGTDAPTLEVLVHQPPHRFEWRVEDRRRRTHVAVSFSPHPAGTLVRQVERSWPRGLAGLLASLRLGRLRRDAEGRLARFRDHVEAGTDATPATGP